MQIGTNQWQIDAADVPTGVFNSHQIRVKEIEFTGYTADTDKFLILNRDGVKVWEGNGKADLSPVRSGDLGWAKGLQVTVLDSGTLYFFIE